MEIKTTEATLNFDLLEQIGSGGEASVFKAKDHQMDAVIAIKKILKADFTNETQYFDESKKLYATKHTNVVPIQYGCRDDEFIYLAMPYYKNGSIKSLTDTRFLTTQEIVRFSLQFLSGLHNIHSKGLIHFDIKTENILINDAFQACVSDFGLAQYTGRYGLADIKSTTLELAPPEFFKQILQHNNKFDIYQAGLAMYRMCNGDSIFLTQFNNAFLSRGTASDQIFINNVQRGKFPDRSNYLPHIPKKLRAIINTALHIDLNKRYATVIDMLNALNDVPVSNWSYSANGSAELWIKSGGYEVTCVTDGSFCTIIATKNSRKNHTFSKKVSISEKNAVLYNCLNSRW